MESGEWVVKQSEVYKFAVENDGACVVAEVEYFDDGESAPCVFKDPDEAREMGAVDWEYFFTDEPESWSLLTQFGIKDDLSQNTSNE